jgi:hypothetical protein
LMQASRIHGTRSALRLTLSASFIWVAIAMACCVLSVAPALARDDEPTPTPQAQPSLTPEQLAQGKTDFIKHCAPCHSESGKGNGPEVKVIPGIKPSDLTLISRNNGGVFPYQQVADTIDGRKGVPSHKRFDMPFWGVNFQQEGKEFTPASEAQARLRIDAVVSYIATLQAN